MMSWRKKCSAFVIRNSGNSGHIGKAVAIKIKINLLKLILTGYFLQKT